MCGARVSNLRPKELLTSRTWNICAVSVDGGIGDGIGSLTLHFKFLSLKVRVRACHWPRRTIVVVGFSLSQALLVARGNLSDLGGSLKAGHLLRLHLLHILLADVHEFLSA